MKAVLCKAYGMPETLVIEEVEPLRAGRGQVVVEVKACGVNFPDTLIIQGKYQFKPAMPFSPGSEVAGVVKEVGEGVKGVSVGDHVIASTGWGGFAEEVVVNATKIIPMPAGLDFTIASAFVLTYGTSHHALKDRAQLQPGEDYFTHISIDTWVGCGSRSLCGLGAWRLAGAINIGTTKVRDILGLLAG